MNFKSDKQRMAVMSQYKNVTSRTKGVPRNISALAKSKTKDTDRDGVVNFKDCKPFDPKKQGYLHDLQIKRLKAQEEKYENIRLSTEKKLENQKELLKIKQSVSNKKLSVKKARLKQKQTLIDEINREKKKITEMKIANKKAKQELFNMTITGKVKNKSDIAIKKTQKYLSSPETKRRVNTLLNKIQRLAN